jgi:hypothetical protein
MDIIKYYLNTIYLPHAISKLNVTSKLNHDLKTEYNKYLDRETFINSDIDKLFTLPIYNSEVFKNYISSLNNSYKIINQEQSLNREYLEKLDSMQLNNILEELNENIINKFNIIKESLTKSESNYTTILDQSTVNRLNFTSKNVLETSQSKENLLNKLDYSEYKKIDPAFYNEIFSIYKKLESKAVDLANVTYSLMGTRYQTLLTLPTYLNLIYQSKIASNLTSTIKSTYSDLLTHIEKNFIRELSNLGKTDFIIYYSNQISYFEGNLNLENKMNHVVNADLYKTVLSKMRNNENLRATADKINLLLNSHGVVNSQEVLNCVKKISPVDLIDIDNLKYKRKIANSIIFKENMKLLNTLDIIKFNYLHDFESKTQLDKVVLYCYLNEINDGIMKSLKL